LEEIRYARHVLRDRLNNGVTIEVEMPWKRKGKRATVIVDKHNYKSMTFAPVSYGGDGKYIHGVDCLLDWSHASLWVDDAAAPPAVLGPVAEDVEGKCDGRPRDEKNGDGPLIDAKNEELNYGRAAPGDRGWWPAGVLEWEGQEKDCGFEEYGREWRSAMYGGKCFCVCVCVYQLFDGTQVMRAWPGMYREDPPSTPYPPPSKM
jgi:hypothetical protein